MSLKPPKKSDLDKSWMKARRDKPKKIRVRFLFQFLNPIRT